MNHRDFLISSVFAASLLLGAAGGARAEDAIKIGVPGPYTGGTSPLGISMRDGIRLAAKEINAKGGVLGRQIELVERDDESKNERGIQIAQELIYKEQIVAAVGIMNSGVALASGRFYQQGKIPLVTPGPAATKLSVDLMPPKIPTSYVFRLSLRDDIQAGMVVDEVVTKWGLKKVAILADSTDYGQLGRGDLEKALEKVGVEPVAVEKFNLGDVNMTPQLLRAKEAGAEVLLTWGVGPELAQIANGMTKLGWRVPMTGSWTLAMPNFIDVAGKAAEGATMAQTFIVENTTGRQKEFVDTLSATYPNKKIPAPGWAAQAYDTTYILAAAINQAGSTDGDAIRKALEDLKTPVEGIIMTYNKPFTPEKHDAFTDRSVATMGKVENGRIVHAKAQ